MQHINEEFCGVLNLGGLPPAASPLGPWSFLLMDVFAGHTTSAVLKLRDLNINPSLILGGCTGPDTAVNKP